VNCTTNTILAGDYRIRLNQNSESRAERSAVMSATAEKRAVISVSFASKTIREFRDS
jgi:hypothetical protein